MRSICPQHLLAAVIPKQNTFSMDHLFDFPPPFFLSIVALAGFSVQAWGNRYRGWGLPMGAVLGTVAIWYHGDAIYNDYESYRMLIGDAALQAAWWQVLLFIMAFGLTAPLVHQWLNYKLDGRRSRLMNYIDTRHLEKPATQRQIDRLTQVALFVWLLLMSVALIRVQFDFVGLFAPYLGNKASPWGRGRLGGGIDALLSLAGYLQIFLAAGIGVLAAVAQNPGSRTLLILICLLTFPYYIFDRTRNTMLATMLPGLLAWVLLRIKGGFAGKGLVLLAAFLVVNFWFSFVGANRSVTSISAAIHSDAAMVRGEGRKHEGLSMFSELGWVNDFFDKGTYRPNWGERYFAELVNPIPRGLWKNKPMIGVDYAVARGFTTGNATDANAGVSASIATGMIGQGVVNFGRFFGPIAAAFLMALWVAALARQDLLGDDPGNLVLYGTGMILTFNMGRDITLLVLYPYILGFGLLWGYRYYLHQTRTAR